MPSRGQVISFFLVVLFLCSWHLDHGHNDNTMARAASVASLVDRGTLDITPIHEVTGDKARVNERYYSDKAPLPSFLVLPFHGLLVKCGRVTTGEHGTLNDGLLRLGGFICGSIPLALLITLAWWQLRSRQRPVPMNTALMATLPLLGSFLFVYSGSFYNHLPGALFTVLAARSVLHRNATRAGLWSSAAFLCESALLLFPLVWMAQLALGRRWREIGGMALGLVPGVFGACLHNLAVTGEAFTFPNAYAVNYSAMHQQYGFGTWQPQAFLHLLFTDYRGLLFYMPFLLVSLIVLPRRLQLKDLLINPYVLPSLLFIAAFLTHATWWGGWTYGPRYLMAAAVLLAFQTLYLLDDKPWVRRMVIATGGFGFGCALAAKMTVGYSFPTGVLHPMFTEIWPRLINGDWTSAQWPVLLGASPAIAAALYLPILASGLYALTRIDRAN
ncbi:MAG: hypothetical protein JNM62_08800 [Flavobacteriales bacterium]|nr:hypothetical protein [Flavobacteriales bacterium]